MKAKWHWIAQKRQEASKHVFITASLAPFPPFTFHLFFPTGAEHIR